MHTTQTWSVCFDAHPLVRLAWQLTNPTNNTLRLRRRFLQQFMHKGTTSERLDNSDTESELPSSLI